MDNPYPRLFPGGAAIDAERLAELGRWRRLYLMFIIARSGSTWLTEFARNAGGLGCPHEWFNPEFCARGEVELGCPPPKAFGFDGINDYLRAFSTYSVSGNCVAGAQLSWPQTHNLIEAAGGTLSLAPFSAVFYLRRRDLVAQAVSLARSVVSGRFHSWQDAPDLVRAHQTAGYDGAVTLDMYRHLADCELKFEAMFSRCGVTPTRLVYEDFAAAPQSALDAMAAALRLDATPRYRGATLQKLRDAQSAEWKARFREEQAAVIAETEAQRPAV
jgi:LPS sulfotransferase NodH